MSKAGSRFLRLRREASVEESLVAMYVAGVSVRRVEDITEALWGERVSPSAVSRLNEKIFERIEEWRNRALKESYPYLFVDGIWLRLAEPLHYDTVVARK